MRDLFLNSEGCEQRFFRLRLVVFAPQSEEIEPALLGMSLTTLGEVPRPVSRFSRVAVARTSTINSSFSNFLAGILFLIKESPHFDQLSVL